MLNKTNADQIVDFCKQNNLKYKFDLKQLEVDEPESYFVDVDDKVRFYLDEYGNFNDLREMDKFNNLKRGCNVKQS